MVGSEGVEGGEGHGLGCVGLAEEDGGSPQPPWVDRLLVVDGGSPRDDCPQPPAQHAVNLGDRDPRTSGHACMDGLGFDRHPVEDEGSPRSPAPHGGGPRRETDLWSSGINGGSSWKGEPQSPSQGRDLYGEPPAHGEDLCGDTDPLEETVIPSPGPGCEQPTGRGGDPPSEPSPLPLGHVWLDPLEETVNPRPGPGPAGHGGDPRGEPFLLPPAAIGGPHGEPSSLSPGDVIPRTNPGCEEPPAHGPGPRGEPSPLRPGHVWLDPLEETVIPCAVCSARANGFHYGADTCAACKVRRSLTYSHFLKYFQIYIFSCNNFGEHVSFIGPDISGSQSQNRKQNSLLACDHFWFIKRVWCEHFQYLLGDRSLVSIRPIRFL